AVREITVLRAGEPPVRFRREGSAWRMVEPAAAPAHASRIAAMLAVPGARSPVRFSAGDVDLARFGLAAPAVTLGIGDLEFAFGDDSPMADARYVLAGGSVWLVPDVLYLQLVQDAGFFVDNRLLAGPGALQRILYPDFELVRTGATWAQRPETGLTREPIETAVPPWQDARAVAVRIGSADGAPLTVHREDGSVDAFRVVASDPVPALARPGFNVTYHLDAATARRLLLAPSPPGAKGATGPID